MKLRDLKVGNTFIMNGKRLTYHAYENGVVVFYDSKDRQIIYGYDAAKITMKRFGYNLKKGDEK